MRGKDQRITFHCLHSHYSMSAVPHHSACQKHWLEEGGIPPGELHICEKERASEMKRGKERPEKTKKCNKCKWCYSLRCYHRLAVVSHVSCVVKIMNSATVVPSGSYTDEGKGGHRGREKEQKEKERNIFDICYAAGSISKGRQEKKELNTRRRSSRKAGREEKHGIQNGWTGLKWQE